MAGGNFDLPENVRQIACVIGREKALYLAGHVLKWERGGHRGKSGWLYIPKRLRPNHRLVEILGWDDAAALVQEFSGMALPISSCKAVVQRWRDSEVWRFAAAGIANDNIAEICGVTSRHVRAIKAA